METYRSYVVSRTPSEEVIRHVYRHLHQYRYINLRAERRVRDDGSEYWETVKWIVYTYWATIEYREWLEVNDLIGPKREELKEVAGSAPPSSLAGSETFQRVTVNPAYYPRGLPEEQFPAGWGGREVRSYYVQPLEPPGPVEQVEVLDPPIQEVSWEEAYRALYELASVVSLVAGSVAVMTIGGPPGWALAAARVALVATGVSYVALYEETRYTGEWERLKEELIWGGMGFTLGGIAGQSRNLPAAVSMWILSLALKYMAGQPVENDDPQVIPDSFEP